MPRLSRSVLSSDSVSPLSCLTFASWCPLSLSAGGRVDLTHASVSSPPDASGILSRPRGRVLPCGLDVKRLRCLGRVAFVSVIQPALGPKVKLWFQALVGPAENQSFTLALLTGCQ
jgi:hypothetical protein